MKTSTKDQIEGELHKVKGKVKETVGQVINSPDLEAEGKSENLDGRVQKKLGKIENVLEE